MAAGSDGLAGRSRGRVHALAGLAKGWCGSRSSTTDGLVGGMARGPVAENSHRRSRLIRERPLSAHCLRWLMGKPEMPHPRQSSAWSVPQCAERRANSVSPVEDHVCSLLSARPYELLRLLDLRELAKNRAASMSTIPSRVMTRFHQIATAILPDDDRCHSAHRMRSPQASCALRCASRTSHGPVRIALIHDGKSEGFCRGMA